jgi:hypothetical protein
MIPNNTSRPRRPPRTAKTTATGEICLETAGEDLLGGGCGWPEKGGVWPEKRGGGSGLVLVGVTCRVVFAGCGPMSVSR